MHLLFISHICIILYTLSGLDDLNTDKWQTYKL